jgi:ankyrin repeat protein
MALELAESLRRACKNNDFERAKRAIRNGADPNIPDEDGMTSLMYAARNGSTKMVSFLLKNDSNLHLLNNYGWNALMFAALYGYQYICKLLLSNGSELEVVGTDGFSVIEKYGEYESPPLRIKEKDDVVQQLIRIYLMKKFNGHLLYNQN